MSPAFGSKVAAEVSLLKAFASLAGQWGQPSHDPRPFQTLVETVLTLFDGSLVEIWEREGENGGLVRRAAASRLGASSGGEVSPGLHQYAARLAGLPGEYVGLPFPELPPEIGTGPCPSVLLARPIELRGRAVGLVSLYCDTSPDAATVDWFSACADVAALVFENLRLARETERAIAKLRSVQKASNVLQSTLDLEELLELVLKLAASEVGAERGTVFLVDAQARELWSLVALGLQQQEIRLPFGRGIAGHVAETGNILNVPDAYRHPLFDSSFDQRFAYRTRNILCLPIRNNRGEILGVLELLNKNGNQFSQEDTDLLATLSVHMALALENAQRHRELLAKQRIEKELALARDIQRHLFPAAPPFVPGYDIAAVSEPCYEVGGDYYDFLSLRSNMMLAVADVEGKGVSSALVMSNLQASLRALVMSHHSLEAIASALNKMIREDTHAQKFVSMFLGLLDTKGHKVHYINAGHVPPLLIRDSQEVVSLEIGGTVIGMFDSPEYTRAHVKLQPGDVLLLCTDGVVEAEGPHAEEYGTERMVQLVRQNRHRSAQELVSLVRADLQEFSRSSAQTDDRVLVVVKVLETPGS